MGKNKKNKINDMTVCHKYYHSSPPPSITKLYCLVFRSVIFYKVVLKPKRFFTLMHSTVCLLVKYLLCNRIPEPIQGPALCMRAEDLMALSFLSGRTDSSRCHWLLLLWIKCSRPVCVNGCRQGGSGASAHTSNPNRKRLPMGDTHQRGGARRTGGEP